MSKVFKRYKLFGLTVWEVEAEMPDTEEVEDEEVFDKDLASSHTVSGGDVPVFGFTSPFDWEEDEDV